MGSNLAWERVHQAVEPLLRAETVVAYLRVDGVQKEGTPGPFFFVDVDHPPVRRHSPAVREALEGPPKVWEEGPHRWRVSATVFQKNHFYRVTFLVTPDGITVPGGPVSPSEGYRWVSLHRTHQYYDQDKLTPAMELLYGRALEEIEFGAVHGRPALYQAVARQGAALVCEPLAIALVREP